MLKIEWGYHLSSTVYPGMDEAASFQVGNYTHKSAHER